MRHKELACGCCGCYFTTWDDYIDQGNDKGYGTCKPCQAYILAKEEAEFDKSIKLISENLNDANSIKFLAMPRDDQKIIVLEAFEDGILNWSIKR